MNLLDKITKLCEFLIEYNLYLRIFDTRAKLRAALKSRSL